MNFKILVDLAYNKLFDDISGSMYGNKYLLSVVNDFQDGAWREDKFHQFIWNNIAETALSHRERNALVNEPNSLLISAAKNLRLTDSVDDIGSGSELAEIFLYGIMKDHYKALPVVPKIFYKQNNQDNAKGSDSVHIVVDGDDFSIWLGEAKFYKSIEDERLGSVIASVKSSLHTEKINKENSIITSVTDFDLLDINPSIKSGIKALLGSGISMDDIRPKLHVPILLLHECDITKNEKVLSDSYQKDIVKYHKNRAKKYFEKQVKSFGCMHMYSSVTFHIILFPVPSKDNAIQKFISNVKFYKGG